MVSQLLSTTRDFFISYTGADRAWAEWVAYELESIGYTTVVQHWDFAAGSNFVDLMDRASRDTAHTIALLSSTYLLRDFPRAELTAALAKDPLGKSKRLIPIRIEDFEVDGLLGSIVYVDLVNLSEIAARSALHGNIDQITEGRRNKPSVAPQFPGMDRKVFPGSSLAKGGNPNHRRQERRFLQLQISEASWLSSSTIGNPYVLDSDPTDDSFAREGVEVSIVLWVPSWDYFRSTSIRDYTPVICVCFDRRGLSPGELLSIGLTSEVREKLSLPPSRVFNEHREDLYRVIGSSLRSSFTAALAVPESIVRPAGDDPALAYEILSNLTVAPLIDAHKRLVISSISMIMSPIGEKSAVVLSQIKRVAKSILRRADIKYSVDLPQSQDDLLNTSLCRHIAWAVARLHNHQDGKWLRLISEKSSEPNTQAAPPA